MKDHQQTLLWKTLKEVNSNNDTMYKPESELKNEMCKNFVGLWETNVSANSDQN